MERERSKRGEPAYSVTREVKSEKTVLDNGQSPAATLLAVRDVGVV